MTLNMTSNHKTNQTLYHPNDPLSSTTLLFPHLHLQATSTLKHARSRRENNDQTTNDQARSHDGNNHNTPPRRRELAADDVVLRLEVAVEANEQHQDGDADEGRSQWLS